MGINDLGYDNGFVWIYIGVYEVYGIVLYYVGLLDVLFLKRKRNF